MSTLDAPQWQNFADAYGFIGNSLLKPMNQTPAVGLDLAFWQAFPTFDNSEVEFAILSCVQYAQQASSLGLEKAVENAAVEYTHLFIGPPSPAAPPWETLYVAEGVTVGFGEATFSMRRLLSEAGLEVSNENNQYEDHMGLELLFLSELCRRQASTSDEGESSGKGGPQAEGSNETSTESAVLSFIEQHPLGWIDAFHTRISAASPRGYYDNLLGLVHRVLTEHRVLLTR